MIELENDKNAFLKESILAAIDELQDLRLEYIPNSKPWNVLAEAERLLQIKLGTLR